MYYLKISVLISIVFVANGYSQNVLIKTDGATVSYKKLKWENGVANVTTDKKQTLAISEENVYALYEESNQLIRYKKSKVPLNDGLSSNKIVAGFHYLLKDESGKINLYKEEVVQRVYTGSGWMTIVNYNYFAEKDDELKNVLITGINGKKDDLIVFKTFFSDDREILSEVESDDFVYNEKNMLKVVRKYNLKHFVAPTKEDYQATGAIGIYTKAEGKTKDAMIFKVNDSLEYKLSANHLPLSLRLPIDKPSKVCVTWEGGSSCELVQPIVFSTQYYLARNFINKTHTLERQNYREFKNYMSDAIQKK